MEGEKEKKRGATRAAGRHHGVRRKDRQGLGPRRRRRRTVAQNRLAQKRRVEEGGGDGDHGEMLAANRPASQAARQPDCYKSFLLPGSKKVEGPGAMRSQKRTPGHKVVNSFKVSPVPKTFPHFSWQPPLIEYVRMSIGPLRRESPPRSSLSVFSVNMGDATFASTFQT